MLFIILTTNDCHFSREANRLWQTLSRVALSQTVVPSSQPCPISFRSLETCSSQLTVCLKNSHLPPSLWPLSSQLPMPRFALSWSGTSSRGLYLSFPPHLVTFQSPLPMAPDHCHSLHPSFFLSPGRPAVSLHCVTLGRFLNLSGPVFSLVKCMFSLTELFCVSGPTLDTSTRRMHGCRPCPGAPV